MRYEDWDVLLFPTGRESKVPMKEFKVACHVVPDGEFSHSHGTYGLPVMTCFIPSLPTGSPFHISIHSWRTPEVSQFTRTYSKHAELVKYEARIFIDGRVVASASFDRQGQWPHLINNTFEFTKTGELEPLTFPSFRRELLYQNHWNPGDDTGRIKVVISEGFPRDSLSTPVERVKNLVAFSFQHAPMDILENNGIAWPNPQMWRGPSLNPALPVPTYHPEEGSESHGHSPRRRPAGSKGSGSQGLHMSLASGLAASQPSASANPTFGMSYPPLQRSGASSGSSCPDPFAEPAAYKEWLKSLGLGHFHLPMPDADPIWATINHSANKYSSTDASMPDYTMNGVQHAVGDAMHFSGPSLEDDLGMDAMQVPTNTPTTMIGHQGGRISVTPLTLTIPGSSIPSDLATSLTHSLLNQPHPLPVYPHQIPLPASKVKSRKENRYLTAIASHRSPVSLDSPGCGEPVEIRKFSQPPFGIIGAGLANTGTHIASNSPIPTPIFSAAVSRNNSGSVGEFDANIANTAGSAEPTPKQSMSSVSFGSDKGLKRCRNLTPASARVFDDEDEPRRMSPLIRLGSGRARADATAEDA